MPKRFDVLQEGLLGDDFFEDCWPTTMPEAQRPPGPRDLNDLDTLLSEDAAVQGLDAAGRSRLRVAALDIERRVPCLTRSGGVLPTPHRLLLAVEAAKVCHAHPRDDIARLASIVVYPGVTKLRRGPHQEIGALLMRGPWRLLPTLGSLGDGLTLLQDLTGHGGRSFKELRRAAGQAAKQLASLRARITPGDALPPEEGEALTAFATRTRALFADGARALGKDAAIARAFKAADVDLGSWADLRVGACEQLAALTDAVAVPAQASIHLPWSMQLACQATPGHDPMIHELAHLVDFAWGGVDGIPSAAVADGWRAAWETLRQGGPNTLDSYARTSPAEFLAVATEAFFTDSAPLQQHTPALATLLEQTWGWVPAPRTRRSNFQVARRLLWSRFSGTFD